MFYRRKVILALLQVFEDELEKIRLQKLLFLYTRRQAFVHAVRPDQKQVKATYDFIPYKFGCFSFSANADLMAMISKGILSENKTHIKKTDETDYLSQLTQEDRTHLIEVKTTYGKMSANALMKHTYIHFPFYAIRSEEAKKMLNEKQLEEIWASVPTNSGTVLYTIGYEGISVEEYLVRLIQNDVKVLVDVRSNPMSMKFGYSKSRLKNFCESLGIHYVHIPEVGIQSGQRQNLNTQADYDRLFSLYQRDILKKTRGQQERILDMLKKYKRIALTCYEADICQCHWKYLAEAVVALAGPAKIGINHI